MSKPTGKDEEPTVGPGTREALDKLATFKREDGFWIFRRDRNVHLANGDIYTDAPFKVVAALSAPVPPDDGTISLAEAFIRLQRRLLAYCKHANAGHMPSDAREFTRRILLGFQSAYEEAGVTPPVIESETSAEYMASLRAGTGAAEPVAWQALPYATPQELVAAFKSGAKFVLHYHGKTFGVTHMEAREHVAYVQPPGLPVKVRPDGSSAEGDGGGIWLAALPPVRGDREALYALDLAHSLLPSAQN